MADNIKSLITALQNLTAEEKDAIRGILDSTEQAPKRKGPPKHVREKIQSDKPVKKRRVIQIEEDNEDDDEPRRGRSRNKKRGEKGGPDGKPCRQEPVQIGKTNNVFPKMAEFGADKHLVEQDKKAWEKQKGQMIQRNRPGYVKVKCKRCRDTFTVGKGLGHKDFVCDECITQE